MKEFLRVFLFGLFSSLISLNASASVTFITNDDNLVFGDVDFQDTSGTTCKKLGYKITSCSSGNLTSACPYNDAYFKECCDSSYKYTQNECSYPKTVSTDSCGGKYKCYCDKSVYKVTSSSCVSPQVAAGTACNEGGVNYYTSCTCPSSYSQTCTGQNQQGSGAGCTQNGVTKYTSCKCKSGYNMTCSDLGPVTPTNYCLLNGIKYYNNCKTCENKCTLASCPAGMSCIYEDCSQKYCSSGCAIGYIDWCTKPETNCAKLGYTKTISNCPNGYLTCPYNSSAVFCDNAA